MSEDRFDVAVIGGGTGGYATALRAAQLGKHVLLVERDERLGGTCLLRGCIPTKALLRCAEVFDTVNRASTWGVSASGSPDWGAMLAFKGTIVTRLVDGLTHLMQDRRVEVAHGLGRLLPGPSIAIGDRVVSADDVVLASGSRPRMLPNVALSGRIVTSDQALDFSRIPSSVVIAGAGAIGLEFASMYRALGAEVTLLEGLPRIAPAEDEEISTWLTRAFKKRKITVRGGVTVAGVVETANDVTVSFTSEAGPASVAADLCLVAIGRAPVVEEMGYEDAGVSVGKHGIAVDESLRTTVDRVWAVGDAAATPLQFAYVAFAEGIAVAERIAGMTPPPLDYEGVPKVTFSVPEVASVGLTEAQARERFGDVDVARFQVQSLGKAQIMGEGGLTKTIADAEGRVVGVHMIGPHATDLVSEAMVIANADLRVDDLARLLHPHPTLSESLGETFLALAGKPLHG